MREGETIEVPDFESIHDFIDWVNNLKEEDIRSWRAKDWNKMYGKLFQCIDHDTEIAAQLPELLKRKQIDIPVAELHQTELRLAKQIRFLELPEATVAMSKLYSNYRMEKDNIRKIYNLALAAGKEAAEKGEISAARTWMEQYEYKIGTGNSVSSLTNDAEIIEKTVYEQSSYPDKLEQHGYERESLRADIKFSNSPFNAGHAANMHKKPEIEISRRLSEDAPLAAIFHEAAHAHLQIFKYGLIDKFSTLKPIDKFDDDFVQLMTNNESLLLTNAPTEKSYRNQPIEYFSHLYGYMAERSFRRQSGQFSERAISTTTKYLGLIDEELAKSIALSNDKDGNVVFKFPSSKWKKRLQDLFAGKDNPWQGKIKIEKDKNNYTVMRMKYTTFPEKIWREFETFRINELAKSFTSKNEFEITMRKDGRAEIKFSKNLPYNREELRSKIYNNSHSFKERLKTTLLAIKKDDIDMCDNSIITPPVYSEEFDRLLNLFKKDKIGFIEAEQKRDAIRRLRRIKKARVVNKIKDTFSK